MFRTVRLSVVSYSLYTQQWYMSYRFADSLQAGSGCSRLCVTACGIMHPPTMLPASGRQHRGWVQHAAWELWVEWACVKLCFGMLNTSEFLFIYLSMFIFYYSGCWVNWIILIFDGGIKCPVGAAEDQDILYLPQYKTNLIEDNPQEVPLCQGKMCLSKSKMTP